MKDFPALLKLQKDKIRQEQVKYALLEREYIKTYKLSIARKYMPVCESYRTDPELVNVIFHLAGLSCDEPPKTNIKLDPITSKLVFTYFNSRLNEWIELNSETPCQPKPKNMQDFMACENCTYKIPFNPDDTNIKCPSCNKATLVKITLRKE